MVKPSGSHASPTPRDYEKYLWQDSKYKGIRTRISKQKGATYESTMEYPVTRSYEVNQVIADAINEFDQIFHNQINGRYPVRGEKFEQNTSYQVIRIHGDFLSIEAITTRDVQSATPEHDTRYWTFNLSSGKEVTLDNLFGAVATDGEARLFIYIKNELTRLAAVKNIELDMASVDDFVNRDTLKSFLVPDSGTIRFDFDGNTVAPYSEEPLTVSLPIANLQLFLQSEEASHLFDIMPIEAAPEWKAPQVTKGSVDCERAKCIALTFDDGPGPLTGQLLDVLKQSGARASFFLIGQNIAKHPDVVKRMKAEGHTIGNHTWDHKMLTRLSSTDIDTEIIRTNTEIMKVTGSAPTYMRPPTGAISAKVYDALKRQYMTAVMWSVDTRDWADRNSDIVYNRVVSGAKPGAIIILHDIHKTSVEAVPRILKALQKQGYAFVSIEDLFGPNAAPGTAINRAQ